MSMSVCLRVNAVAASVAVAAATGLATVPVSQIAAPATVEREIRLAAMVPPGGLITSFLRNQTVYCSIICPLLVQTATTAVDTAIQAPQVFLTALPTDGLLKAIGVAAASVTGPTDTAAETAIAADAAIPAQRALNAFEVGVIGLLNIIPAAAGGPTAILAAIQQARQDTFDALNAPFVPNPTPTVMPHGVFQVAVIQAINVVAAVIFPAFNDVLAGVFQVPNAMAQTLAATGDPIAALAAGATTAVKVVIAVGTVIANAITTAINNVRAAAQAAPVVTPAVLTTTTPTSAVKTQIQPQATVLAPVTTHPTSSSTLSHRGGQFFVVPKPVVVPKSALATTPVSNPGPKPTTTVTPSFNVTRSFNVTPSVNGHGQLNVRGSHDGLPSRPALRAKR
ncbi:hypothetical protein [Mycobacterium sp. OTB74]|jgi:hypothetical protein|uniref:hypothetical protein n=1 Tax=Mycobacterium sp. OTB74 TaxID=1853452 RepID=UPI00247507F5|nr:hypothetical protein [Mycobacterium sp. OTB74]MDH6242561.1 hypothetical protein [Mycobacterium sp. OTB74]